MAKLHKCPVHMLLNHTAVLHKFDAFISEIWRASGVIMYLSEPEGAGAFFTVNPLWFSLMGTKPTFQIFMLDFGLARQYTNANGEVIIKIY